MHLAALLTVLAAPVLVAAGAAHPVGTVPATWDGQCAYPRPQQGFKASRYVGPQPDGDSRAVWYQLAAQDQPFSSDCRCVNASYGSFRNGTVTVENRCVRGETSSGIKGVAPPAAPEFGAGAFRVDFGARSTNTAEGCQGPNYIVQKAYYNKPGEKLCTKAKGRRQYETVIVSSDNFDGWFVLSRTRNVEQRVVEEYIKEVAALGNPLTKPYSITDQSNCPAVP